MAIPLPTGWQSVASSSSLVSTCAGLLANSTNFTPSTHHKGPTANNLSKLLKAHYQEPNATAGLSASQPLFYLYYCSQAFVSDNTTSPLCVAFYKTIKTFGSVPSSGGAPTRRWWCLSVGVPQSPASGWSYEYVKSICAYFYYTVVLAPANQSFGDILVLAEDAGRQPNPAQYEADQCLLQLDQDPSIQQLNPFDSTQPPPFGDQGYKPWTQVLSATNQISFTQLTF
jgi:hypothetical protein